MKFFHVPEQDQWKIPVVDELLNVQNDSLSLTEFDRNDLNEILRILTTSKPRK